MDGKELADPQWYDITEVGLSVKGKPTWDEYQVEFVKWSLIHKASAFAIGDLLSYGEHRWGETYAQVSAVTNLAPEYLRNVKYVCESVPIERRRENLSFSHHQVVASIKDHNVQSAWLMVAETYDLTRDELRQEVKRGINPSEYVGLLSNRGIDPPKQEVIDPPRTDLRSVVADFIRAVRGDDEDKAIELIDQMEIMVKDLL